MTISKRRFYIDDNNVIRTSSYDSKNFPGGLGQEFFNTMKQNAHEIAQIEASTGRKDTFASLLRRSVRTAIELKKRGVKKGDVISLCASNHFDMCVPFFAAMFSGARFSPLEPSLSPGDLQQMLKIVRPKFMFVDASSVELVEKALETSGLEIRLVCFGETKKHLSFSEFVEEKPEEEDFRPEAIESDKETAVILYSSGTTGLPKGIKLSHRTLLNKAHQVPVHAMILWYGTFYWISGLMAFISRTLLVKPRLVVGAFDPKEAFDFIRRYEVQAVVLTVRRTLDLLEYIRASCCKVPESLKGLCIVGERILQSYYDRAKKILPGIVVSTGYGLTEAGGIIASFQSPEDYEFLITRPMSVGRPLPGISYRVVDLETGKNLPLNESGELLISTELVMNGYLNLDPSAAFEGGWLRTGDIVRFDDDFCLYVVDRVKELIEYHGQHVEPAFLERVLDGHPAVDEVVVVGVIHEKDGQYPVACVMLRKGFVVEEEELRRYVDERVGEKKQLTGGVRIVDALPLAVTGKVARRKLKEDLMAGRI